MEKRQASSFYPHFDTEERPTIDYLVGLFNNLVFKKQSILTDFLDPGQREILKTIVGNDAFIQEFGGYEGAEKKRVYLSEEWENLSPQDYQITPLEINYPQKFLQLRHGAILGTLANSGISLDTFGDIITDGNGNWQFFVKAELLDFFTEQIDRIGRAHVKIVPISLKKVLEPEDNSVEVTAIVASLRADAILAGVSKQSRGQIKQAVEAGLVKLNWHDLENSNIMVKVKDVLSLRHFGRLQIIDIVTTRKGKYRVVFKLWQTQKHN
ncbi:RNA-binding protein [Lactobacillus xujianguonis]|uniref:RNA-binding protein n=1 Tax=Lactobacillus xujianguonis TaxID=2495899 RepID=A0A437STN0_9LACO|nr:YlmH/Sll1252 family protein [Lactobacillus xujianguonis]RVU70299.1 RNA-binding protein [Lactobacillus xujianguonis]RVU73885.1 RNA-binding protein [Lactobacillus xujianguonis]